MRRQGPPNRCPLARPPHTQNLNQNPRTLLPKFYGLYCVQSGGKNIRVAVMNNVLPRAVHMHLKFDLKGSTYKRRASKKEREKSAPTFKDLDFIQDMPEGLLLDADTFSALVKTLQRDCLVSPGAPRPERGAGAGPGRWRRPLGASPGRQRPAAEVCASCVAAGSALPAHSRLLLRDRDCPAGLFTNPLDGPSPGHRLVRAGCVLCGPLLHTLGPDPFET